MAPQAVTTILQAQGDPGCPQPLDVSTCMVRLKLTATQYSWTTNLRLDERAGDAVVNQSEIDFFNGPACGLKLPAGVGRYSWTVAGVVLHFAAVANDPCPRRAWLDNQSYSRAS